MELQGVLLCVISGSATKWMRTTLLWVMQWLVLISYRRFGTIYRSHLQRSSRGLIGCPKTSVRNYHYLLRNNPEERSFQGWLLFIRACQCGNSLIMDCNWKNLLMTLCDYLGFHIFKCGQFLPGKSGMILGWISSSIVDRITLQQQTVLYDVYSPSTCLFHNLFF
jgi:hypothetical protein